VRFLVASSGVGESLLRSQMVTHDDAGRSPHWTAVDGQPRQLERGLRPARRRPHPTRTRSGHVPTCTGDPGRGKRRVTQQRPMIPSGWTRASNASNVQGLFSSSREIGFSFFSLVSDTLVSTLDVLDAKEIGTEDSTLTGSTATPTVQPPLYIPGTGLDAALFGGGHNGR
jgi:hypothetical protein